MDNEILASAILRLQLISEDRLNDLRKRVAESGQSLAEILIQESVLTERQLTAARNFSGVGPSKDSSGRFGKYQLLNELGRGAMSVVYRAEDATLKRQVALKVFSGLVDSDEDAMKRFEREAQLAARLKHPFVVSIHEANIETLTPYIAMELVEGITFTRLLERASGKGEPLEPVHEALAGSLRARVEFVRKVATAVQYAHERDVIHRDLKPSNIMVDKKGNPQVADFGLARDTHSTGTLTGGDYAIGTPAFMAPEQARGETANLSERTDVYALGVILYNAVALRRPFPDDPVPVLLQKVLTEDPEPLVRLNPEADSDLQTICGKAMEKEQRRRYATAGEFAEDLRRWLDGEGIAARPENTVRRMVRRIRRYRMLTGAVAAVAVSISVFLIFHFSRPAYLEFEAWPQNAIVEIDGKIAERASISLAPGRHLLKVRLEGHRSIEEEIEVSRGEVLSRRFELKPILARLTIRPSPYGMQFTLRGEGLERVGKTPWGPFDVPPGPYRIQVWGRGCIRADFDIDLKDGDDREFTWEIPSAVVWKRTFDNLDETPVAADINGDGTVDFIIPSTDARLYAVSGIDGETIWKTALPSTRPTTPVAMHFNNDGVPDLAIGASNGFVALVDGKTGASREVSVGEACYVAAGTGDIDGGGSDDVLISTRNGHLICIRYSAGEKLTILWRKKKEGSVYMPPLVTDLDGDGEAEVVFATRNGVSVHDLKTGEERLFHKIVEEPRIMPVSVNVDEDAEQELILGCFDGTVVCLKASTGKRLWTYSTGGKVRCVPTIQDLDGDGEPEVLIGSDGGNLVALRAGSGGEVWKFSAGGEIHSQPTIGDVDNDGADEVVFGSDADKVFVLDASSGRVEWWFACREDVDARVHLYDADGDGLLEMLVCSDDQSVYCLTMIRR